MVQKILNRSALQDALIKAGLDAAVAEKRQELTRFPEAAPHWAAIAEYVVEKKAAGDYAYPQFLTELKKTGVKVPELPKPKASESDDTPF